MSRLRPGADTGHSNGMSNGYGHRYDLDASSRDTSADERSLSRGPGGYGGLGNVRDGSNQRVGGVAQLERRQANRRSQDRGYGTSRSRSRPGARFGNGSRQVEDVLRQIEQQWSFMSSESCVPVKVALQLMDTSSLGFADQYGEFQETHQQLQSALKAIVNEHHQGFNSSIGTFHQIQGSIQASQLRVRELKQSLLQAKGNLNTTRPELKAFATSSQNYDEMLQMLGWTEELQTMPEVIEAQITEKKFLGAVETLQSALRLMRKPELEDIGALSDLQVYLSNQEHSVTDILIEELHSHLYLKSPYCEHHWKKYAGKAGDASNLNRGLDRRQLYSFLDNLDVSQPMIEDPSQNAEADTFGYIQLLIESLDRMSRLDLAIEAIEQRLPVELFRVVERCYNEVEQRHPSLLTNGSRQPQDKRMSLSGHDESSKKEIIDEMLTSLFAKFEAIAEGHRALHEVVSGILRRQNLREPSLLRSFDELWKLYQSEIRSLLHDHLSTSGNMSHRSRQEHNASANIFRVNPRDRTRRLFKLSDTDTKSTGLASEREALDYILKASVPGLVSPAQNAATSASDQDSRNPDRSATGHKLLVEPSVFNMALLLPPSLSFLSRLREIVPQSSDMGLTSLTSFLDEFLINVFQPQMEETLADMCMTAVSQIDAFQEDAAWQEVAPKAIFKSTRRLDEIIGAFCKMLDSLPPNQAFSQLVIAELRRYYSRCYDLFRSLVTRPQLDSDVTRVMKRAAAYAEKGDFFDLLRNLFNAEEKDRAQISDQETLILLQTITAQPLQDVDLINDRKSISQLSTLCTSLRWLTSRITSLRHVDSKAPDVSTSLARFPLRQWTSLESGANGQAYLPLTPEITADFDALTTSFTELSTLILRTLHLELRLQLLHGIHRSLSTTYLLGQPYNDPDPAVIVLNKTLLSLDEDLALRLSAQQYSLCTTSLAVLADAALVSYASAVPAMDANGNARMQLNILVLQQNLKELDKDASLAQAARYWELFEEGPDALVQARRAGLEREHARELVRLMFSSGQQIAVAGEPKGQEDVLRMLE